MEKNTVLVIVVAVLVVVAAIQAVELAVLNSRISSGSLTTRTASTTVNTQSSGSVAGDSLGATSLDDLSAMQGGC